MSTVAIMAGGKSTRMGEDKLMLRLNGETLLERAVREYRRSFDTVLISVTDADKYAVDAKAVEDVYPDCGPLGGLYSVLLQTQDEGVFVVAADMPFTTADEAKEIIGLCGDAEACVPVDPDGRPEPLFAYYKKVLVSRAEECIRQGKRAMRCLLELSNVRTVPSEQIGGSRMLENLNTPDDFLRVGGTR